jgi:acetyl esterase/lipase
MTSDTVFILCAFLSLLATTMALVKARAIGWAIPLWFLVGWLTSELAVWWLVLQCAFVVLMVTQFEVSTGAIGWGLGLFVLSWLGLARTLVASFDTGLTFERALKTGLGEDFMNDIPLHRRRRLHQQIDSREWLKPFHFSRPSVIKIRNIPYGDEGKRNLLDIVKPRKAGQKRPVLLQIHGGAWMLGHKGEQGQPLLHRMAELGWVGVAINYRLSPANAFPAHIIDVKKAIAWIKEHIEAYDGDPDFIVVTGGSAGGHLCSLAALTPNYAPWQPGFEEADTTVQGAMPLYACFDFTNRFGIRQGTAIDKPIMKWVMQIEQDEQQALWEKGSPIAQITEAAPPFMVIQGTHDTLIWVEEARRFVAELSGVTQRALVYAELPGAQHAFEFFHSPRTSHYLNGASTYLEWVYGRWCTEHRSLLASVTGTAEDARY